MELKNRLNKPYSDNEKLSFIIENNQELGYKIIFTETALEAWGYTEEEKEKQEKIKRNNEIDSKIKELQEMCISEMMNNNTENIKIYNEVIQGLINSKFLI